LLIERFFCAIFLTNGHLKSKFDQFIFDII